MYFSKYKYITVVLLLVALVSQTLAALPCMMMQHSTNTSSIHAMHMDSDHVKHMCCEQADNCAMNACVTAAVLGNVSLKTAVAPVLSNVVTSVPVSLINATVVPPYRPPISS